VTRSPQPCILRPMAAFATTLEVTAPVAGVALPIDGIGIIAIAIPR
jgi:hypothetical protein